jgi:magnesium transporter
MRFARLVAPDVRALLREDPEELREALLEFHPADLADVLAALEPEEAAKIVLLVPEKLRAQVFEFVPEDLQVGIVARLPREKAAMLIGEMAADERTDLVAKLPEETRTEILPLLGKEEAQELRTLAAYPKHTAGGRMTTEFVRLREEMSADEAIAHVRSVASEKETVYYGYVLGPEGELRGVVSLALLVMARPTERVGAIMEKRVIDVRVDADQEEVARVLSKYDLLAVPVVDERRRVLGIVTVDDVLDVVREEGSEDIHRLGAVAPVEQPYLRANFWSLLWKRAGWLILIFVGETFTGSALRHYEDFFLKIPDLVLFLPLLISSGGNSGAQSSTLVIRAIALGDVTLREWWKVVWRELRMGLALGAILGAVGYGRAYLWGTDPTIMLTVALALLGIVLWGDLIGALLPLLFRVFRLDPAFASGPFVATFVDVSGVLIYLWVAYACIPALGAAG